MTSGVAGAVALLDAPVTFEARIRSLVAPAPDRGARRRATVLVAVAVVAAGHATQSATGTAGLLTQRELRRLYPSAASLEMFDGWTSIAVGADYVQVIWARPTSLGWKVSDRR